MSHSSRYGSHSSSHSSHHHSSRSRSGRDDYHRGGSSAGLFGNPNPFSGGGSSRSAFAPSVREMSPHSSHRYRERSPPSSLGRASSTRRRDDRPTFYNPFGGSSSSRTTVDPFGSSSRHSSRHSSRGYDDHSSFRPLPTRRGGADHSALAHDFYDPFAGELGTGSRRQYSIVGDPELPSYRSASAYARGSNAMPPGYDVPGSAMRSSFGFPPPYSSFSSQGGREPMQYPATRRPSHYGGGGGGSSGLPGPDYFHRKRR